MAEKPGERAEVQRALTTARLNLTIARNAGRGPDVIARAEAAVLREQGRLAGINTRSTG